MVQGEGEMSRWDALEKWQLGVDDRFGEVFATMKATNSAVDELRHMLVTFIHAHKLAPSVVTAKHTLANVTVTAQELTLLEWEQDLPPIYRPAPQFQVLQRADASAQARAQNPMVAYDMDTNSEDLPNPQPL